MRLRKLRKRAMARSCNKTYVAYKDGGFDILDAYGGVGFAEMESDEYIAWLIKY